MNWRLVAWLCAGSVPSAFLGVLLLRLLGDDAAVQHAIKVALGVALLLAAYPKLRANDLVGTDLVQAVPLVAAAALGHAFFGDLQLDIAAAVLVGSIPGVLIGARISSRAPGGIVRAALVIVLLASALKLLDVPNAAVGVVVVAAVLAAAGIAVVRHRRRPPEPDVATTEEAREPAGLH